MWCYNFKAKETINYTSKFSSLPGCYLNVLGGTMLHVLTARPLIMTTIYNVFEIKYWIIAPSHTTCT